MYLAKLNKTPNGEWELVSLSRWKNVVNNTKELIDASKRDHDAVRKALNATKKAFLKEA